MGYSGQGISGPNQLTDDAKIASIPLDTDIITIMAGTNDMASNAPIGALPGKTGFKGWYSTLIQKNPSKNT